MDTSLLLKNSVFVLKIQMWIEAFHLKACFESSIGVDLKDCLHIDILHDFQNFTCISISYQMWKF